MSAILDELTKSWSSYTEDAIDGTAALLAQVVAQAERDITQAMRGGYVDAEMRTLKLPVTDDEDYHAAEAVVFLKSSAAAELCEILVQWSGGHFDLRPAKRLAKALAEGAQVSGYDRRAEAANARSAARRQLGALPSEWQIQRDNGVSAERLPAHLEARLDAEGQVRGKTWRMMPRGTASNRENQALNWALWKRGLELNYLEANQAEKRALGIFDERRAA